MRYLVTLGTCLIVTACLSPAIVAQNFGTSNNSGEASQEAVTFVLELDDAMIEALKRGEPLKSSIPPHLRNKVTEVRLRYVPSSTADRGFDQRRTEPISTPGGGFSPPAAQPPRFQPSGTSDNSAAGLLPRNDMQGGNRGSSQSPNGIPQFRPPGQTASTRNDPGFNSRDFNNNDRTVPQTRPNAGDTQPQHVAAAVQPTLPAAVQPTLPAAVRAALPAALQPAGFSTHTHRSASG